MLVQMDLLSQSRVTCGQGAMEKVWGSTDRDPKDRRDIEDPD